MIRKRVARSPGPLPRLNRRFTIVAGLAIALAGCDESSPTQIELPLVTGTIVRNMTQEVTSTFSGDPDGIGKALITLDADLRFVCWSLTASNITLPATASHIHKAAAGVAGPIALGLTAPGANGSSSGCAEDVDRALILEMLESPTSFYVNVHTTDHPPGAIRAQFK